MDRQRVKRVLGKIALGAHWTSGRRGDVVVTNAHCASAVDVADMVSRLSHSYDFATMADLASFEKLGNEGVDESRRPKIVLTFDDGFACHYEIATHLADAGIGAVFFVVPGFVEAEAPLDFAAAHIIRPTGSWSAEAVSELIPLQLEQIREIAEMGHVVGSHTMTHFMYNWMPETTLRREIVDSRNWIEDLIQRPVDSFAGPFTSELLGQRALELIHETYTHNFLTFPSRSMRWGDVIWRSNLEPRWSPEVQEYVLRYRAVEAMRYRRRRERLLNDLALGQDQVPTRGDDHRRSA